MQGQNRLFLKTFMKNNNEIGSITPSSKYLVREIIKNVDFNKAKVIVELGMGTGVITKELIRSCNIDTKIIGFEKNKEMFDYVVNNLQSNVNPIFIHDNVYNLNDYLFNLKIKYVDCFVCSLPLANFQIRKRIYILKNIQKYMNKKSILILYQYTTNNELLFKEMFKVVKKKGILLNIPPAIVYVLKRK